MVYNSKFVMCVLVDGKPQKELANGVVNIPFNSEYTLRFRNKYSDRRAIVKFTIDGEDVSGGGYIIPADSYIDIERMAEKPVKFKFVSLDSEEAIDFGKNGPNENKTKGTIEARFHLEKPQMTLPKTCYPMSVSSYYNFEHLKDGQTTARRMKNVDYTFQGMMSLHSNPNVIHSNQSVMRFCSSSQSDASSHIPLQDGCTVEGNYSNQSFQTVWFSPEADYVSVKIFLQGYDDKKTSPKVVVSNSRIRELEEENLRLKKELEEKMLRKSEKDLEEENRILKEKLSQV